MTKKTNWNSFN